LAEAPDGRGGSWSKDDKIVFAPSYTGPLMQVPLSGGLPTALTELDNATQESSHRWPRFLPDGRHLLLYVEGQRSTGAPSADPTDKTSGLYVFDLKTKEKKFVVATDSDATFAAGYLVYLRRRSLIAQPFYDQRGKVTGPPVPLLQQEVAYDSDRWSGAFTVAPNGLLAYLGGQVTAFSQLQWIDRSGKILGNVGGNGIYLYPALSPDGKRVAVQEDTGQGSDVWIIDLGRGTKARFTFDGQSTCPVWSPDGKFVAYASDRAGKRLVFVKDGSGLGKEQAISTPPSADQSTLTDWSPDGQAAILSSSVPEFPRNRLFVHWFKPGHKDDWVLPESHAASREATFAPDSKWLAYSSDESGRWKVYVVPFPDVNGKFQISSDGGMQPRWRRDGKELYYLGLDRKLMAVAIAAKPSFKAGIPQTLVTTNPFITAPVGTAQYDISADGRRFLVSSRLEESTAEPIAVVTNWTAGVSK
jgi:eukaryotic-like serine/threonine-protein kinase